ncbi:MAG: hypothetical protein ACFCU3_00020 [Verrucomicrobiales bacterium]
MANQPFQTQDALAAAQSSFAGPELTRILDAFLVSMEGVDAVHRPSTELSFSTRWRVHGPLLYQPPTQSLQVDPDHTRLLELWRQWLASEWTPRIAPLLLQLFEMEQLREMLCWQDRYFDELQRRKLLLRDYCLNASAFLTWPQVLLEESAWLCLVRPELGLSPVWNPLLVYAAQTATFHIPGAQALQGWLVIEALRIANLFHRHDTFEALLSGIPSLKTVFLSAQPFRVLG